MAMDGTMKWWWSYQTGTILSSQALEWGLTIIWCGGSSVNGTGGRLQVHRLTDWETPKHRARQRTRSPQVRPPPSLANEIARDKPVSTLECTRKHNEQKIWWMHMLLAEYTICSCWLQLCHDNLSAGTKSWENKWLVTTIKLVENRARQNRPKVRKIIKEMPIWCLRGESGETWPPKNPSNAT